MRAGGVVVKGGTMDQQMPSMKEKMRQQEEQQQRIQETGERIGNIILVLSGKGGVGKSTVAANLAWSLAQRGNRVGLMDADLHGPTIPLMTGLVGQRVTGSENAIEPVRLSPKLAVMSIAFMSEDLDAPTIWRGPLRSGVLRQFIADVDWGELDYLIVDLPPGTGDEPLTIMQVFPGAAGSVIVTTPQEASLSDCRKAINFVRKLDQRALGVIENMSGFVCPHCGERTDIFSTGGGERMAQNMGVPFLGRIPIAAGVVELGDSGQTLAGDNAPEAVREAFTSIVDALVEQLTQ